MEDNELKFMIFYQSRKKKPFRKKIPKFYVIKLYQTINGDSL
jgi:hypothetical protein